MNPQSIPTRGRTLDHAAAVYDALEPILLLGKQADYDRHLISMLNVAASDRILDLGCGTGVLTRMIAVARKKRASVTCRFEVMAAEDLDFRDTGFDAVVSSLFFHHVPLDL